MAAELTRLTYKIAIQLHLVARAVPFAILTPGGQSGNFWIHLRINFNSPSVLTTAVCIKELKYVYFIRVYIIISIIIIIKYFKSELP
jgi:hypothetical protein